MLAEPQAQTEQLNRPRVVSLVGPTIPGAAAPPRPLAPQTELGEFRVAVGELRVGGGEQLLRLPPRPTFRFGDTFLFLTLENFALAFLLNF